MNLSFGDFFEAVWGYQPYPWQIELADRVQETGWPDVLDIPTGAGKSAVLDIALYHFVATGGARAPRRMILVVDRRIIVDQVAERANRIRGALDSSALKPMKERLVELVGPDVPPLVTSVLRGGIIRDDAWAAYPHVPVLAGSTVDQVGSRLLFRGYGLNNRMRPMHAGLLGCDTLFFLDEVHLSQPFAEMLGQLMALRPHASGEPPLPFNAVQLSATPGRMVSYSTARRGVYPDPDAPEPQRRLEAVRLSDADRRNEHLSRVLRAAKPAALEVVAVGARTPDSRKRAAVAERAAIEARTLLSEGRKAVAVVVNRVDTARRVWSLLQGEPFDVELLTGRMRPFDQAQVIDRIRDRVMARRKRESSTTPLVVVATQCIEAGADYDFDGMVTELAPLDALRQRFGRLDREGVSSENAESDPEQPPPRAVILARSDLLGPSTDPVYGDRLRTTWDWLNTIAAQGIVDFGIDALQPKLDDLGDKIVTLLSEAPDAPVLLPAYLDQWAQTNPRPHADPDVSLFLHGIPVRSSSADADVRVVWRADLSEAMLQEDDALLGDYLAATPPGSAEALALPVGAVKQWLAGTTDSEGADIADVEGVGNTPGDQVRAHRRVLVWGGSRNSRSVSASAIRPGDTIIVPTSYGGIGPHLTFDPSAQADSEPALFVTDLGDIVQLRERGRASLRLNAPALASIFGNAFDAALPSSDDIDVDERTALSHALDVIRAAASRADVPNWFMTELLPALGDDPRFFRDPLARLPGQSARWIVLGRRRPRTSSEIGAPVPDAPDEDDESFTAASRPGALRAHLEGVSALANKFAEQVLVPAVVRMSLKWAGLLHDVGKADPRFQALLYGGDEIAARFGELLAKSDIPHQDRARRRVARRLAQYPPGQRHELVSVNMIANCGELRRRIEADGGDWDLVLHLVAAHHGWARPLAPFLDSADLDDNVEFEMEGMTLRGTTAHGLDCIASGLTDRFWRLARRYGHYELAYYEAILRLADHRHSADETSS